MTTLELFRSISSLIGKYKSLRDISRTEAHIAKHSSEEWGAGYGTGQATAYEDVIGDLRKLLAKTSEPSEEAKPTNIQLEQLHSS